MVSRRRSACAIRIFVFAEELVGAAEDAGRACSRPVRRELRVDRRKAVADSDVGELDFGRPDLIPVDGALVDGDVNAFDHLAGGNRP